EITLAVGHDESIPPPHRSCGPAGRREGFPDPLSGTRLETPQLPVAAHAIDKTTPNNGRRYRRVQGSGVTFAPSADFPHSCGRCLKRTEPHHHRPVEESGD